MSLVEASAGTGKTKRLVDEIVAAVAGGVPVDRIVAVTFTHAAAGSMKVRVRQELERRSEQTHDPVERQRLRSALQTLDRAFIGTIHAFCAHLLRQRPVEACVDPAFQELSEPEASAVFSGVFRRWIEHKLGSPSPVLRRALYRLAWKEERSTTGPLDSLESAARNLAEWRDYDASWERREFDREGRLRSLVKQATDFEQRWGTCARQTDPLYLWLRPVSSMMDRLRRMRDAIGRDADEVETELLSVKRRLAWEKIGSGPYGEGVTRESVVAAWKALDAAIDEYRSVADADLASELHPELFESVMQFQRTKRRAGQLDFTDLLIYTRDLLRNRHAREDLQGRYDRIFVDEFQDTDPLQAEILLLLCASNPAEERCLDAKLTPGKLFVVADPKQSIYRFRRADSREYRQVRDALLNGGLVPDRLQSSHRSSEILQQFVNAAFEKAIPDYLPLSGGCPASASQPSLVALPVPYMHKGSFQSPRRIAEHAPDTTAAFIDWLVNRSGWTVRKEGSGERVPVAPKDICVLFRKMAGYEGADLSQEYVRGLEARGIDHTLVGSKSFHRREEIGTIRAALRAIEWPEDELSVFAVLRGAMFFIADSTLLKFREQYQRFSPFRTLPDDIDDEFHPVADVLGLIKALHRKRNTRSPAETIQELLRHARAHAGFAFHRGGERRLANVYRLCDLARSFDVRGRAASFRQFVEYLEEEALAGEQSEVPLLEQQAGGVQLMTVHKAKGLEFPVVILAELTTHATQRNGADRYIDSEQKLCAQRLCGWAPWELLDHLDEEKQEDEAEATRLAYVAATRARDLLVVSAVGACQWKDSWLTPLHDALYPARDQWRTPETHPGCPVEGSTTVFDFPPEMKEAEAVRPGVHRAVGSGCEVYWFDPKLLDLREIDTQGLDRSEMLFGTEGQLQEGITKYHSWRAERDAAIAAGAEPQFRVRRATENGAIDNADAIPFETVPLVRPAQRPANREFGRIVHAILQAGIEADAERLAAVHARRWNAGDDVAAAAAETARAAFTWLADAAANAREIHRELPVAVTLSTGEIAEGVVDLAWSDGSSWTVVDYKTGRGEKRYESQLKLYAFALQQATGLPAKAILLEI